MQTHLGLERKERLQSTQRLFQVLADTYTLYLKTQNYHWNVVGETFYSLHLLFEKQYRELAEAIDEIAERIRALDGFAPGSFSEYMDLSRLESKVVPLTSAQMLRNLLEDHETLVVYLREAVAELGAGKEAGTVDLLIERLRAHEKMAWFLRSSLPPS
jgi:starvation-inducible DNA-binding protein